MKRMNEVFELPLTVPVSTDDELIDDKCVSVGELVSRNYAKLAAHAINHVDALVDALHACAKVLAEMPAGEPTNESDRAYHQALDALNAYRGVK